MIVVSNTSPINYLTVIGQAPLLPALFGTILIPESVRDELEQDGAPDEVRQLVSVPPGWLQVVGVEFANLAELMPLDLGERDAIQVALDKQADLLLMDESRGRRAAARMGIITTGTIGVLDRAIRIGMVDGATVASALRKSSFRAHPRLLALLEAPAGGAPVADSSFDKRSAGRREP